MSTPDAIAALIPDAPQPTTEQLLRVLSLLTNRQPVVAKVCGDALAELATLRAERDALAAAMPSEGADAALAYAAERTESDRLRAQLADSHREMRLIADRHASDVQALAAQLAEVTAQRDALRADAGAEISLLRTALRFYARTEHYHCDPEEEFDTVSGEPANWLFSGRENSGTMIEDGSIARQALRGEPTNYIDGDEDTTPQPIEGEVSCIAAIGAARTAT